MKYVFIHVILSIIHLRLSWQFKQSYYQRKYRLWPLSSTVASSSTLDSDRLKRARLRLAEAQGIIPIGASEQLPLSASLSLSDFQSVPSLSKVREIGWRVAEPAVKYDSVSASSKLFAQPLKWLVRNVQFIVPVTIFCVSVILDIISGQEEKNRIKRADELLDLISAQSPAIIKGGQVLSSRSDLLPKEYLDSLQKLQDRCPAFPNEQASKLFEDELGLKLSDVFDLDSESPVAAASIGQV